MILNILPNAKDIDMWENTKSDLPDDIGFHVESPIIRLLVLENYGDVEQGSVVRLLEKNSHFSLCETGVGQRRVKNEILDPYFYPGEGFWAVTADSYVIGEFIHHTGPQMGLVSVEGIIDEVFLDQITRIELS